MADRHVHGGHGRVEHGVDSGAGRRAGVVLGAASLARQGAGGNGRRPAARPATGGHRAGLAETVWPGVVPSATGFTRNSISTLCSPGVPWRWRWQ